MRYEENFITLKLHWHGLGNCAHETCTEGKLEKNYRRATVNNEECSSSISYKLQVLILF
jgi:hypothetical protein